jgi:hypothetical protein
VPMPRLEPRRRHLTAIFFQGTNLEPIDLDHLIAITRKKPLPPHVWIERAEPPGS